MIQKTICRDAGTDGKIEYDIAINVSINRELTQEDAQDIRPLMDKIKDILFARSIALNADDQNTARSEKNLLMSAFSSPIFVEEIPNGYCSQYCCKHKPWFIVTTKNGRIKIGCRKRVVEIDWSDSTIELTAEDLFPEENVTKGDKYIHAWGMDKVNEYIKILEHPNITGQADR